MNDKLITYLTNEISQLKYQLEHQEKKWSTGWYYTNGQLLAYQDILGRIHRLCPTTTEPVDATA